MPFLTGFVNMGPSIRQERVEVPHDSRKVRRFVSCALKPAGDGFVTPASANEPPVPGAFLFGDRTLVITRVLRKWRSTKSDRGDVYLKRHWYELRTASGATLEVYCDRESRRGTSAWWLYTIDE